MYDSSKDLLDALRATPSVLEALLYGCTQEQARTARGGDEGWSVVEVVCHLRDAEERALERMRSMRDAASPHLAAYDQERGPGNVTTRRPTCARFWQPSYTSEDCTSLN